MITLFPERPGEVGGGVEGAAATLVAALGRTGRLDLHVLAPHRGGGSGRLETFAGATIHRVPHPGGPAFLTTATLYLARLQGVVSRLRPDVVHCQALASWMPLAGPRVLTVHGIAERDVLYSHRPLRRPRAAFIGLTERLGRRRAAHTIVINPHVTELLGPQLRGRMWHIPNPVASDFLGAPGPARAPNVLYAGRLSELKDILGLIEVFARVRARLPEATLTLAGAPESAQYEQRCRLAIERLGLGGAVRLAGRLDRAALVRALGRARCLALLSRQEMAPLVISEAQAAGVPPVAHAICGVPHMIEDGVTGLLVPPGDAEIAADRLARLLGDDALLDVMSAACRAHARCTFAPGAVATRTLEVYEAAARA